MAALTLQEARDDADQQRVVGSLVDCRPAEHEALLLVTCVICFIGCQSTHTEVRHAVFTSGMLLFIPLLQ